MRKGFDYYLEKDILKNYHKKPLELRLKWLFMGNKLRKYCSKKTIKIQNKFREGKI
jgi:hypothetical protein